MRAITLGRMRNLLLVLLICLIWCDAAIAQPSKPSAKRLSDIHKITTFLGTFPCECGLLQSPALQSAFKQTLGKDYPEYQTHISLSGCGRLEMRDEYAFAHVSQLRGRVHLVHLCSSQRWRDVCLLAELNRAREALGFLRAEAHTQRCSSDGSG
jgi:hypothetical protein